MLGLLCQLIPLFTFIRPDKKNGGRRRRFWARGNYIEYESCCYWRNWCCRQVFSRRTNQLQGKAIFGVITLQETLWLKCSRDIANWLCIIYYVTSLYHPIDVLLVSRSLSHVSRSHEEEFVTTLRAVARDYSRFGSRTNIFIHTCAFTSWFLVYKNAILIFLLRISQKLWYLGEEALQFQKRITLINLLQKVRADWFKLQLVS